METRSQTLQPLLPRNVTSLVDDMLSESPAVVIQGARQVGKSTLLKQVINRHGGVIFNLDDGNVLRAARTAPDEFVRQQVDGILAIDEVQRAPELMVALKAAIDDDRRPGRFLLTGSADLLHISGANESLAGRAETTTLWGLSQGERTGVIDDFLTAAVQRRPLTGRTYQPVDYPLLVTQGGYPEATVRPARGRARWFDSYARSVIDHDAVETSGLVWLDRLDVLLRWLAAGTGQELVLAQVSRATGVPERSLPAYLRLLENLYLIKLLPPWGRNLAKRVVGKPKAHLADTGLAAHMAGVTFDMLADILQRPKLGGLLETFVVTELEKQRGWSETPYRLFHFRDSSGPEVDVVAELADGRIVGIEVKSAQRLGDSDFKGLRHLRDRLGSQFVCGVVLYTGLQELPWGTDLYALPVSALWQP